MVLLLVPVNPRGCRVLHPRQARSHSIPPRSGILSRILSSVLSSVLSSLCLCVSVVHLPPPLRMRQDVLTNECLCVSVVHLPPSPSAPPRHVDNRGDGFLRLTWPVWRFLAKPWSRCERRAGPILDVDDRAFERCVRLRAGRECLGRRVPCGRSARARHAPGARAFGRGRAAGRRVRARSPDRRPSAVPGRDAPRGRSDRSRRRPRPGGWNPDPDGRRRPNPCRRTTPRSPYDHPPSARSTAALSARRLSAFLVGLTLFDPPYGIGCLSGGLRDLVGLTLFDPPYGIGCLSGGPHVVRPTLRDRAHSWSPAARGSHFVRGLIHSRARAAPTARPGGDS